MKLLMILLLCLLELPAMAALRLRPEWTTQCGSVRLAKTKHIRSAPVVYLHTSQPRTFLLHADESSRGFSDRLRMIETFGHLEGVCLTGYVSGNMMVPYKVSRSSERFQYARANVRR